MFVTIPRHLGRMGSNHQPSRTRPMLTLVGFLGFMLLPALFAFAEAQIL